MDKNGHILKRISVVFTIVMLFYGSMLFVEDDGIVKASDELSNENVLIYVLSNRTDSDGWYTTPLDVQPIVDMLLEEGFTVDIKDKIMLPEINQQDMLNYTQIWIVEGDEDYEVEVSQSEAEDLYTFYVNGGGVWISWGVETGWSWAEDALVFANRFFVNCNKYEFIYGDGQPVSSSHFLFENVSSIGFITKYGCISSTNPNFESIWSANFQCTGIGIIDSFDVGRGRCIFDSGWMIGYAYCEKYDDLVFIRNAAYWLIGKAPSSLNVTQYSPTAKAIGPYSGQVNTSITFDASNSFDNDGTIISYEWDFGDDQIAYGISPTHSYDKVGEYMVTLVVTDNQSLTDSDTTTVTIIEKKSDNKNFGFDNLLIVIIIIILIIVIGVIVLMSRRR